MTPKDGVLSVFDPRVRADDGWELQEKRHSGFRKSLRPARAGAALAVRFEGRAISLLRAPLWQELRADPAVDYFIPGVSNPVRPGASVRGKQLAVRLDGGPLRTLDLGVEPVEIPLAEALSPGPHELTLFAREPSTLCVLGFRTLAESRGEIRGRVEAERAEYLNDVAVTLRRDGRVIDRRLDRNPYTGEVRLWGLEPGAYDLELEALGWEPVRASGLQVRPDARADFGTLRLKMLAPSPAPPARSPRRPGRFRIVKFGHMDTWHQRNAEYLRLLAELTNLYDPDLALISNEVNWQYVHGALRVLQAPFLLTPGNHALPGFEEFFGPRTSSLRMGEVFIANHGHPWESETRKLEALFAAAGGARYRVLQGVEGNLPPALAERLAIDLYACGHGWSEEAAAGARGLHLGKEFQVVDIDLATRDARVIRVTEAGDRMLEKYPIPRDEPFAPVTFTPANNGTHAEVTARVVNPMACVIPSAKVDFVMPPGTYRASMGTIERQVSASPHDPTRVTVRLDLPGKATLEVTVSLA